MDPSVETVRFEFWRGKRVLVTGHTGFKGAWLVTWLRHLEANVSGLALAPPTEPNLFDLAGVSRHCEDHRGDVRNRALVRSIVSRTAPEIVFHLAAQPLVRASYLSPLDTFEVNVMGTANVLDAVRDCSSVKAVVIVTSDKCYRNDDSGRPFAEDEPLGGKDPYSASKACTELVASSYRASFFSTGTVGLCTARAGNVVGGGDFATDRLLPDLIRAFVARRPASIRNPNATRPFQYVLDPLYGYLALAEYAAERGPRSLSAFNFAPLAGETWNVARVADAAAASWGEGACWQTDGGQHAPESPTLALDGSLANTELGIRSRFDTTSAIQQTIQFHRRLLDGDDPSTLALASIRRFEEFGA